MKVTVQGRTRHFRTVTYDAATNQVRLIEQRLLPHQFKIIGTKDFRETARAITDMIVRGAGAIGATAAYGLAQGAASFRGRDMARFIAVNVKLAPQALRFVNRRSGAADIDKRKPTRVAVRQHVHAIPD